MALLKDISMRQLRYFVAAAENSQFSLAASAVNVSQSAVTTAVSQLEAMLAVRLFERLPHGVKLTAEGHQFYHHARHILDTLQDAVSQPLFQSHALTGQARVGASYAVLGYYLLVLIGRRGWLGGWLHDTFGINLIFTWQGAVIAASVVAFPLVFKPARAAFEAVDGQLEQAARILGMKEAAVFFRITLPLAWRGIMAGLLLAFARALGEFGATLMVAGSIPGKTQTLSIAIYEAVQAGQDDTANMLVLVTSVVCIAVLLSAGKLAPGQLSRR